MTVLVVDIGNTTTKVGAWDAGVVRAVSVSPTPEVGEVIEYRMQQSDAYLSMPDPEQPATFYIGPQTEGRLYELNAINPD